MKAIRSFAKSTSAATPALAAALLAAATSAQNLPGPPVLASPSKVAGIEVTFPPRPMPAAKNTAPAATPTTTVASATATTSSARTSAAAAKSPSAAVSANVHAAVAAAGYDSSADFNAPIPDEKTLHLVLGHSVFIDTKHRLSRVYITNPEVLSSYTANPNQVVVTAKQPGVSTLIVWDEVGDTQVYMVSSETAVAGLSAALKKAFPSEEIDVNSTDGRVILSGTVGTQAIAEAAGKMATQYSKDVSNTLFVSSSRIKQVRLKVRFAEVDRSRISQFGFNLFAILNGNGANPTLVTSTTGAFPSSITTGAGATSGSVVGNQTVAASNPLNFVIYNASHNIGATIQDLEDKQIMHILAEPNITTMSGQKANFLAGGEFPFPVVQGGGTAGTTASITVQFRPYGVKLEFTPLVNADGTIDLTVAPEVSALDYSNAVTISGYTIPALSTRRAATQVVLRNGQSFAISGLLDRRTTDALGRTPGIASVPVLGALFRSKNINHSTSELLVIVTPEIVDPLTDRPPVPEPTSPIPLLNPQKFDNALPDTVKKPSDAK